MWKATRKPGHRVYDNGHICVTLLEAAKMLNVVLAVIASKTAILVRDSEECPYRAPSDFLGDSQREHLVVLRRRTVKFLAI
jgi:hypothetical protein